MDIKEQKELLRQTSVLTDHYQKIIALTGENFNVFSILGLERSEVRLHSAFLASMLNPKEKHGQKATFLKLFIDRLCFNKAVIDLESAKVEVEKYAGLISESGFEGGRIDIVISDNNGDQIIIENKIDAGDQINQLVRYSRYAPNANLIYLTLEGKEPSANSCGDLIPNTHYWCASYKKDIISWLEECRKEVVLYPIVRESITQYINLIKSLTNQTLNHNMSTELNELLLSNLEASFTIYDNLDFALDEVFDAFVIELENACKELDLNCDNNVDNERNFTGITIFKSKWRYVNIAFQFQSYEKELIYGLQCKEEPNKKPLPAGLREQLSSLNGGSGKKNIWWPWSNKMEDPLNNWGKYEAWSAMIDGSMKRSFIEKIMILIQLTENIEM